jgi:hypothetical protein
MAEALVDGLVIGCAHFYSALYYSCYAGLVESEFLIWASVGWPVQTVVSANPKADSPHQALRSAQPQYSPTHD